MINDDFLEASVNYGMRVSKQDKANYFNSPMGKSKIEWTDRTWNPTVGCSKVSQGCKNCYAMVMSSRVANAAMARLKDGKELTEVEKAYMATVKWESTGPEDSDTKALPVWSGNVVTIEERLHQPLSIRKPQKIFVDSMTDLFHPNIPFEFIDRVFSVMILAQKHTFQILTKRPKRMSEYVKRMLDAELGNEIDRRVFDGWRGVYGEKLNERPVWPMENIWVGTSVENQEVADERIPELLKCPAEVRFLSCEPLLGPLDLEYWFSDEAIYKSQVYEEWMKDGGPGIHQVIVGGESGPNARPIKSEWVKEIHDDCNSWDVAFFFKQWGEWLPFDQREAGQIKNSVQYKSNGSAWKVGKHDAGNLLDGEEHLEFPKQPNEK